MIPYRYLLSTALLLGACLAAQAQNLVKNPGFEAGESDWTLFVPPESTADACTFIVEDIKNARSGRSAARLTAFSPMRFGIGMKSSFVVSPHERYRIAAWYRAESGATVNTGTPGFLIRANFIADESKPSLSTLHLGPGGLSPGTGREIGVPALAEKWTRLEAVIAIPEGVERLGINCFLWLLQGTVMVDDVVVELVAGNTPLTAFATNNAASPVIAGMPPAQPLELGEEKPIALANLGFESGLNDWDNSGDADMSRSTPEAAYRGDAGLRVEDADTISGSNLHSPYFSAAAGRTYQMRFWSRAVEGEGVAVYFRFFDAQRKLLTTEQLGNENLFIIPNTATRFRLFTHEALAPEGTASARIWIHSFNKATATADFDDITLFESLR